MLTEVYGVEDAAWPSVLDGQPHDVYHLPAYARLDAAADGENPVAVHVVDGAFELFLPIVLRPLPPTSGAETGLLDARSPYGYPSPLVLSRQKTAPPAERNAFLRSAVPALVEKLRELHVVSAFIRLHPLPHLRLMTPALEAVGAVTDHGESVWVDLTQDDATLRSQLRTNHKRDLAKLAGAGFVGAVEEDWEALDDLKRIYRDTMDRVGAGDFYRRSDDFFSQLAAMGVFRIATVRRSGEVIAAGLFSEVGGHVQYYVGGTAREYLPMSPAKLLLLTVQHWAKERGNVAYNLGSGSGWGGAENPLFRFKLGFSPLRGPVRSWQVVVDPDRYQQLVEAAPASSAVEYFPAYRHP